MLKDYLESQESPPNIQNIILGSSVISLIFNILNFPLVGLISFIVNGTYHEMGHALCFWLGSVPAIPFFMIMTFSLPEFGGWFVFVMLSTVLFFSIKWSRELEAWEILGISSFLSLSLFVCTVFLSKHQHEGFAIAGGLMGESFLSSLAIILACSKLPSFKSVNEFRYLFAVTGPWVLASSITRWSKISMGFEKLPYGALIDIGGAMNGKSDGDIDRLIRDFHFTAHQLKMIFTIGAYASAAFVILALCLPYILGKRRN